MAKTPREAALVPDQLSQGALALYRKYRPASFDTLVGQPGVVQGLKSAVETGRVAHAYLFSGPRGTGKTSVARILAKCVNCLTDGPRPDPCGKCEACVSIADGTAFDVIEIDAASNRGINEIRELRERVKFAPSRFRKKVYIIDEVHMLTSEAFNALLKTLEEPPEYVVFVLATTEPYRVPPTIMSRCQRYEFRRVSPADIVKRLDEVARLENIKATPEAKNRIAYLADGALRDALVLLEQARGFAEGQIDETVLDEAFGSSHRELIERIVDAIATGDAAAALGAVADAVAVGVDPAWLTKECLRWFRLALLALVNRELVEPEVGPEQADAVIVRASRLGRAKVLVALRYLSECAAAARFSTQPRIDLELCLARIVLPGEELTLRSLSDRLHALEENVRSRTSPANATPAPKAPAAGGDGAQSDARKPPGKPAPKRSSAAEAPLSSARLSGMWPMVLTAAKARSVQAYAHLQHTAVLEASDELVTISVDDKFNRDRLAESSMTSLVADAIAQASGVRPHVRFVLAAPAKAAKAMSPGAAAGLALAADVFGEDLI
jgi:DNA polymerase-3 subunit gamma/tau